MKKSTTDNPAAPAEPKERKPRKKPAGLRIVEVCEGGWREISDQAEHETAREARTILGQIAEPGKVYAIIRVLETGLTVKEEVTRRLI